MGDEVVWDGWGIEGGDLVAEALTRRPPVGPEMTAETPRAGDGKAGEAAAAGDLAAKRCQAHVPVRSGSPHRSRTIGRIRPSGSGA